MKQVLLVIDDGENIETLFKRITEQYFPNLHMISSKNGTDGLEMVRVAHPDMILLDVNLPDVNGFELCRKLRADPQTKDIRILMLSGVARESADIAKGLESGADGFIVKPFVISDLVKQLQKLMPRK